MIHRIIIPDFRFTSLNEMNKSNHWSHRSKAKKYDREMVWAYAKTQDVPNATSKRRVSLEITLCGRQQETDPDALWKSCLDALVNCGMLCNDTSEWCELGTVSHFRGEQTETVIVLEDV